MLEIEEKLMTNSNNSSDEKITPSKYLIGDTLADIDFIKTFLKEMAEQENQGTSAPYYYTIKDFYRYYGIDPDMEYEGYNLQDSRYPGINFEDYEHYVYYCIEYSVLPKKKERLSKRYYAKMEKNTETVFFTYSAAEKHLNENKHLYSKEAQVTLSQAFRSPELKRFFLELFKRYNIDNKNWR